ncbi:MAG: ring-opening amidohydrolase [Nannocystis sp.]|uniref:cyanuric acid amidohydrolase n=1 Tax=Nannocystis sp. TaxID=1962667 RepID=UPI002429CB2D|nr:ring-opening amidohydrolase [Nannocystis sp.]MBK9751903.1 ring-opening amidohydrolase [Nannocystis sp.]
MRVRAFAIDTRDPADVDELRRLLDAQAFAASDVIAVIGKTEGNGGRNDFSRGLAMAALEHLFAPRLGVAAEQVQDRVIFSFSGGTEGVVAPHMLVLVREGERASQRRPVKRLAVAIGHTRAFAPEEIGRMPQIEETARLVREIAGTLDLDALADVHLVQMKGAIPKFSPEQAQAAERAGRALRCDMVGSRAASALGVALALGEVERAQLSDEVVCNDWSLYSGVASCSAKPGQERTEIVVFANSPTWTGDLMIEHGILADILDIEGVRAVARKLGLTLPVDPAASPLVGVFAKSEADPRGRIRGRRHTMLSDDDISDTRYSRCVLSSVLAATLGDTRVYVSTRAEHHGPLGGGPLAIVARLPEVST